jgi:hypothetical protein
VPRAHVLGKAPLESDRQPVRSFMAQQVLAAQGLANRKPFPETRFAHC